jgi:hypothetical protein
LYTEWRRFELQRIFGRAIRARNPNANNVLVLYLVRMAEHAVHLIRTLMRKHGGSERDCEKVLSVALFDLCERWRDGLELSAREQLSVRAAYGEQVDLLINLLEPYFRRA